MIWSDVFLDGVTWPYKVSRCGLVARNGRLLALNTNVGYARVGLCRASHRKWVLVHRLVAEAFVDNPEGKPEVNHIDGNKLNNRADNLEWVTRSENALHAHAIGLHGPPRRLADAVCKSIREDYATGLYTQSVLGSKYGVSKTTINHIINRNRAYANS